MTYLLGVDEAGYGPNLGPLVVSASLWQAPEAVCGQDLYETLSAAVARRPACDDGRLAIADSKTLYQSGGGWALLERGLWAALAQLGRRPRSGRELWQALTGEDGPAEAVLDALPLPRDARAADLEPPAAALKHALADAGARLVELRSRAVFPARFNALLEHSPSKGAVLSGLTLELVGELIEPLKDGPIAVVCDKHGGRDRYAPLLAEHFPQWLIEIHGEGRRQSLYRFGPSSRRVEVRFCAKAEAHLPVALASMASKYLRELAMRGLNEFWRRRVPGLRPTAGYPQDARRFKADIAAAQAELGIEDRAIWRVK